MESSSGKLRTIINHSFPDKAKPIDLSIPPTTTATPIIMNPETTSINTALKSKKFQCQWGTFSECYLLVANAPPGSQAAVFDVESAFRNIPIHPSAWPFLAMKIDEKIHLDTCLNFGASPSPGIWGIVADAMAWILKHKGVQALIKWVDDFVFFRYPKRIHEDGSAEYTYDADLIWHTAKELGWPWAIDKFKPFQSSFTYVGFDWDIAEKFVSLPDAKKTKYLNKLESWVAGSQHTKDEIKSIIGIHALHTNRKHN